MTNEKGMLGRAGLDGVDALVAGLTTNPETLARAVGDCESLLGRAMEAARRA
ncbi:Nucleotidyltransferase domain-containing protein OS=Streptomyces tendae OX=1932 GN=GUR47_12585 PE=4 SV=1 [Streptomyces tendae]